MSLNLELTIVYAKKKTYVTIMFNSGCVVDKGFAEYKFHRKSFPYTLSISSGLLKLIEADLAGRFLKVS